MVAIVFRKPCHQSCTDLHRSWPRMGQLTGKYTSSTEMQIWANIMADLYIAFMVEWLICRSLSFQGSKLIFKHLIKTCFINSSFMTPVSCLRNSHVSDISKSFISQAIDKPFSHKSEQRNIAALTFLRRSFRKISEAFKTWTTVAGHLVEICLTQRKPGTHASRPKKYFETGVSHQTLGSSRGSTVPWACGPQAVSTYAWNLGSGATWTQTAGSIP